jgi:hypothetical protein
MLRIYHAARAHAYDAVVAWRPTWTWRPSWRVIVILVFAADVAVAAIAWVIVGLAGAGLP